MPPRKDTTAAKVHPRWRRFIEYARKTGDLALLAGVLKHEPQNLSGGDLQLLGELFEQSKLIAMNPQKKKRGPKSRPVETRLIRAAEVYRAISKRGPQIKALIVAGRVVAFAADPPSFSGVTAETLVDRQARIKAAADFADVTVEQLEQHFKRGRRRPAKRQQNHHHI